MADETISTRIVANADFSALIADVHKVTASLSRLQEQLANSNKMMANQIAVMNRSFADTLRSTGQFSTHFVSLQSDVEKFGKNLDGGKLKLGQYFNTFRDHAKTSGGLIRDLAKQQVALQNSVLQPLGRNAQGLMQFNVHVPRGLDEVKNKTAIVRQELQIMNKVIQDGAGQLINWGKNTQWAGRQLTVGLTVPLVAFGAQAAKAFREADQELVRLTKVYGDVAGTSAAELGRVRDEVTNTAKEISAAMGVSFKETIALAADIAATGKTGNELLGSIQETTRLAVLGEVDRQEAMKATLAIQSAFKQNTDELSESINFLNAVENQTSTTLNDLVEAIPKAGPVIQGLGGSVQDLALYLTAMREGGINASEGANALKSALASLINPTDVAVKKFQGLGIDLLGVVNNNAGDLTGTLMALQGALDNLDPLQKQQAIEQLFGKFQFSRLNALFENLGREGSQTLQVLDLMKASTSELASVADRELAAVTESASGKYRRAIESLRASLAEVGEQFLQINTVLIQVIDKIVQFANNLPGPVKQILALAGGFTAIIGPVIMLTGVLANFFGYLLKGAFHIKAFFKGNDGWKYLTPEMLAAEKAGKLVEQSFYSDAKAAAVLQQALRNLLDEFALLEQKAKSGAMAVNPAVSTMAGNLVMAAGGQRVVDPNNPLAGTMGTRASSHMVPRSGMSESQRLQQTMFGMVPGSIPVNQKIGQNPQIYMNEPLPNVPGLTTVGGVSTGIVSGEAARWHAMMATLGMQSKAEVEALKKTIVATGTVSKEFMMQFDDILPVVSRLTDNAARESALIVAELRAGKLTVEAAKAKIVALNLQTEQMIASSVQSQAVSMGRTINPTMVPTLNQPVVDPTGKSNMRELFKKGRTRDFINKIAGVLGVRTSGAGYNIETTVPRKMNMGGYVYTMNDGNIVPGPNVNRDVVPAMLTPGEFVVNKEATSANLPLLRSINSQNGSSLPIGYMPPEVSDSVLGIFGERPRSRGSSSPGTLVGRWGMIMPETINGALAQKLNSPGAKGSDLLALLQQPDRLIDLEDFLSYNGVDPKDIDMVKRKVAADMARQIQPNAYYADGGFGKIAMNSTQSVVSGLENKYPGISLKFQKDRMTPGRRDTLRRPRPGETQAQANARGGGSPTGINYKDQRPSNYGAGASRGAAFGEGQVWGHFADQEMQKNTSMLSRAFGFARRTPNLMALRNPGPSRAMSFIPGLFRRNSGGMIPGYNMGGMVMPQSVPIPAQNGKYNMGGMVQGYNRGGMIRGLLGASAVGIGGQMLGQQVGGGLGSAITMGSYLASSMIGFGGMGGRGDQKGPGFAGRQMQKIDPQGNLTKPIGPLNNLSDATKKLSGNLGGVAKMFGPLLRGFTTLLKLTSPLGLAITGVTAAIGFFVKAQRDKAAALETGRQAFGMDAEAAEKAGFKYTDYNAKIKEAIENAEALKERNTMIYESMTRANVPISLTIEQYKKLKEQVKETMGSYIELFDQTNRKDVGQVALQLKAQFMAAGDSAEVATAKIFTMIKQSENANMAASAISSNAFQSIQNMEQASAQTVKTFEAAMKTGDAESQARALHTVFMAMDASLQSTVEEQEKLGGTGEKAAERVAGAMESKMASINKLFGTQANLSKDVINELGKTDPLLSKMLNDTDTLNSAWAKYKLTLSGVTMNFQFMTGEAAIAANELNEIVKAQIQLNPSIVAANKSYKNMTDRIKELEKAQKGQSVKAQYNDKEQSKRLQEQIAEIKKAAQEKINGIRKATEAENTQLEIQKAQLRASQALIQGNMSQYAEEQMTVEQLMNEANRKDAEEAIIAKAEIDVKPLQDALDAMSDKNEKMAKKAALAGESLSSLQSKANTFSSGLTEYTTNLNNLMTKLKLEGEEFKMTDEFKETMAALKKAGKDLGITNSPEKILDQLGKALSNNKIVADRVTILTDKIMDGSITGSGTRSSPFNLGAGGSGAGTSLLPKNDLNAYGRFGDIGPAGVGQRIKKAAEERGIAPGSYFSITDKDGLESIFYVEKDGNVTRTVNPYKKKSLGGQFAAGDNLLLNDRKNALGTQMEGIAISPNFSGMVYPNAATMPTFNVPSGTKYNGVGPSNTSSSSNVYNIDIDLNGTTVTADDVLNSFKRELALINAKEGISRRVGA
jgi:TP901 family phage tail tape measure protein